MPNFGILTEIAPKLPQKRQVFTTEGCDDKLSELKELKELGRHLTRSPKI